MDTRNIVINETYRQRPDVSHLMTRLPEAFAQGEGDLIYDKRNKLRRFALADGLRIVVKQYKHPNLFQQLCYSTFWANKAEKSFRYAGYLTQIGIDTPLPVAYVTYRRWGLVTSYYLATTEVVGTESHLPMRAMNTNGDLAGMQCLASDLACLLVRLHEHGFMHGDANLSNFICRPNGKGGYDFSVIDINRSKLLHRPATYKECIHNLCRTTHIRPILKVLASAYAQQRGWDADQVTHDLLSELEKFEKRKELAKRLK